MFSNLKFIHKSRGTWKLPLETHVTTGWAENKRKKHHHFHLFIKAVKTWEKAVKSAVEHQ